LDFTVNKYIELLKALQNAGYVFLTFRDYMSFHLKMAGQSPNINVTSGQAQNPQTETERNNNSLPEKFIILRHDVDARPENSLLFAIIQEKIQIKGSYYFRVIRKSYDENIIREISDLGHEIGYHYENMDTCNGNIDLAFSDFVVNLKKMRSVVPIDTICMHGSPLSKYDNRELWEKFNYRSLGIIGEPYFDIDFNKIAYFTDTGRRWNGHKYSIRDKTKSSFSFDFKTTNQIIKNITNLHPNIMFTFHPQRWTNNKALWLKELILQNIKNIAKRFISPKI
jgi:hypothetical protein